MTKDSLQEAINNKAQANVQRRIEVFRKDISAACERLWYGLNRHYNIGTNNQLLAQLLKDDNTKGWPSLLWDEERRIITADVLSKMDIVQQLLNAEPCVAIEEPETPKGAKP